MSVLSFNGSAIKCANGAISFGGSGGSGNSGGGGTAQTLAITSYNATINNTVGYVGIGGVYATGGLGAYTYSCTNPYSDVNYEINATNGNLVVYAPNGNRTVPRTDHFTVSVSDATGATASANATVVWTASDTILPSSALVFYNSQSTNGGITFNGFGAYGPDYNSSTPVTITDASGVFSGSVYLFCHQSAWPTPGNYPLTVSATANGVTTTANYTLALLNDPGPSVLQFTQTTTPLSSLRVIGTVVGQGLADGSAEYTSYALSNNAGGKYNINGLTGVISVAGALSTGTDTITVVATRSGLSLSKSFSIAVVQGTTLPASNMTMTVASNLTNAVNSGMPLPVGTPYVTGITGTPVWSLVQPNRSVGAEYFGSSSIYAINSSTGAVTTINTLSAQTDALTLICTDGINTCSQTFNVVVSAITGPTIYVGQGMSTTHGSTLSGGVQGFEHLAPLYKLLNTANSAYAGATVYIYSNSDQNYYANDNQTGDDLSRFGTYGPLTVIGMQGSGGIRPRLGGPVGCLTGGVDEGGKGFWVTSGGDFSFSNIWFSDVHANGYQGGTSPESNTTGCALRSNGQTYGNITINNCLFTQCDQGGEFGDGPYTVSISNTEANNCGGIYVGSGATHNFYVGGVSKLVVNNVLSWNTINGHTFKTRAQNGTFTNCRFYDAERGGASCQLEIPDGGNYTVSGCTFHKGAQPQNPNSVQFCAEMQVSHIYAVNNLAISNSTFINNAPSGASVNGVYMYGQCSVLNGAYSTATSSNNSFIGYPAGTTEVAIFSTLQTQSVTGVSDGRACAVVSTGRTTLASQPALSLLNPQTGSASPHPPVMYVVYDGENRNNWVNYANYQIDPDDDDLRFSASATTVGTVLFTPSVAPSTYAAAAPSFINPFASGGVWSIVAGAMSYVGGVYSVAPVGKYSINTSTGALSLAQSATAGTVDNIILSVTSGGTVAQQGFYIAWT